MSNTSNTYDYCTYLLLLLKRVYIDIGNRHTIKQTNTHTCTQKQTQTVNVKLPETIELVAAWQRHAYVRHFRQVSLT